MKTSRRKFIQKSTFCSAGLIWEHSLIHSSNSGVFDQTLIEQIILQTHVPIPKLIEFYHSQIGLPLISQTEQICTFAAGNSLLSFQYDVNAKSPFYHFAFNIPENKIKMAEEWQLQRSQIIQPPARLLDPDYNSRNIVHFRHWDAHSIFFYDPAGNVVEYIARHTLDNGAMSDFSVVDILNVSEIGLVVSDVNKASEELNSELGLRKYSTSSASFAAHGDENGLILLLSDQTKAAFRQGRQRRVFPTKVVANVPQAIKYEEYPYTISRM